MNKYSNTKIQMHYLVCVVHLKFLEKLFQFFLDKPIKKRLNLSSSLISNDCNKLHFRLLTEQQNANLNNYFWKHTSEKNYLYMFHTN